MMKVLHTADLHLKSYGDKRWQALQALLELGAREKVNVLAICGDLFERGVDLLKLQDPLRTALSGLPFTVLVLPGNHDSDAFGSGIFLGDCAVVLDDWQHPYACGEAVFWGLPFEPLNGVEIVNRLRILAARMDGGTCSFTTASCWTPSSLALSWVRRGLTAICRSSSPILKTCR